MTRKKLVKLELTNPRYSRAELKDHASEFIHYARYAGYVLKDFNHHLTASKLHPVKPEISERNNRLVVETTIDNAKMLSQIIRIYPSFSNWRLKMLTPISERTMSRSITPAPRVTKKKVKKAKKKSVKKSKASKAKKAKKVVKKRKVKASASKKKTVKKVVKKKKSTKKKVNTKKKKPSKVKRRK